MNLNLIGKRALVCGSTAGIGWASAIELALLGAEVCLIARNEEKLKQRLTELPAESGQNHHYLVADFSKTDEVRAALKTSKGDYHILVNNTGGPAGGQIIDESAEKFQKTFEQHLVVNQLLTQHIVPFMKAERFGRIVNVISVSVKQPIIGLGVSNTIRWAVASWAKTLSKELSHSGITVNNILPGFTMTSRLEQVIKQRADREGKSTGEIEKEILASIPSGKFADAEEVGAAVAYLCSPVAASVNGINLPVDGGLSASL
ncbi:SDR family oxidoreductase [Jiulongibacter sediminis]|uniref:Short-chain dehydrogenase n=1 Tax=Jiulongibacter sediminis TaxID=1605367 RepID=A0A0N8H9P1_9BACT|nr:SDR family oxidoreductase [Jiulongibacter sediminis]KPM47916.1 short-chain dehydrogenase [Jiulongibacter sediminis]TBX24099.1 short-chain dehydrogenase [Jiulongibacter sediminis]